MDERTAEIVKELQEKRERLGDSFSELEIKVREASNWRTYYQKNPWPLLGVAAGIGFLFSGLFVGGRRG